MPPRSANAQRGDGLAGEQTGEQLGLQLGAAVARQRRADHVDGQERPRRRRCGPSPRPRSRRPATGWPDRLPPPCASGTNSVVQPELGGLAPPVALEPVGGVPQRAHGGERRLAVEETPGGLAEKLLVLGELEVHGSPFSVVRRAGYPTARQTPGVYPGAIARRDAGPRRDHHGVDRRGRHVSRARRALEPARAAVPRTRAGAGRRHRDLHGEQRAVHGDHLGRAARRLVLDHDQLASHRARGRVHRRRLRSARVRVEQAARARSSRQMSARRHATRREPAHGRRCRSTAGSRTRTRSPSTRPSRSPTSARVALCSTRRARRASRRASSGRWRSAPMGEGPNALTAFFEWCGFVEGSVYLSPAPLYHAAPIAWSMAIQRSRRHRRADGALRRGAGARAHRALRRDMRPVRPHDVRPHAQAPGGRARRRTTCRACDRSSTPRRRAPST